MVVTSMENRPQRKRRNPNRLGDFAAQGEVTKVDDDDDQNSSNKKPRKRRSNNTIIDLSDIPYQPPILKSEFFASSSTFNDNTRKRPLKEGASKYMGVYFRQENQKWRAQMMINGKVTVIGNYLKEKDAASDYARAALKYKAKTRQEHYGGLDLSLVPNHLPLIMANVKSGFKGVKANKQRWEARISIKGKLVTLGTFDTPEQAAAIYAKADYYCQHCDLLKKQLQDEQEAAKREEEEQQQQSTRKSKTNDQTATNTELNQKPSTPSKRRQRKDKDEISAEPTEDTTESLLDEEDVVRNVVDGDIVEI